MFDAARFEHQAKFAAQSFWPAKDHGKFGGLGVHRARMGTTSA
jgi:hypothetical protein